MHQFSNQSTRRPSEFATICHQPPISSQSSLFQSSLTSLSLSSSTSSSASSSTFTSPSSLSVQISRIPASIIPTITSSTIRRALLSISVCCSLTVSAATPLTHNLPSEAAKEMEGLLQFLPTGLQLVMSSSTGFMPAFLQSLLLILACELGDRTFFVAAILAMKSSRIVVWCGALSALAAMTVLSAAIGKAFPMLLNKRWTSIAAALLFLYFGLQLLRDWWRMRNEESSGNEELAEVEEELRHSSTDEKKSTAAPLRSRSFGSLSLAILSPVFAKALSMTALAEWGDRSQIATIALAANRDIMGVIAGGVLGHGICTGLAVIGGRLLASRISEKAVAFMGGVLFVIFAALTVSGVLD